MKIIQPRADVRVYSGSLLLNGGPEQGDSSPIYWVSSGANASTSASEVYTGSRSFMVIAGSHTWTSDFFDCDEDTEYTLRMYLKGTSSTATVTVNYYDSVGVFKSSEELVSFTGTRDFYETIKKFDTPTGCFMMKVVLANTTGVAYFDTMGISEDYFLFHHKDLMSIEVYERQGRVKTASLLLHNPSGKYSQDIQVNYNVEIWFGAGDSYSKKFAGVIASSPRVFGEDNETISIDAEHGDALFLYDRCNGEAYSTETWEDIIVDLIGKHFDSITTNNVGAFGGSITKTFTQRETLKDAMEYIMEQTGWIIYLDDDWDLHFETPTLTDSEQRILQGDNITNYNIDYDKSLLCNCVGVYYDTGLTKYVEVEDRDSIIANGGRFKQIFDREIYTTETTAKDFAQTWVDSNKTLRLSGSVRIMDTWVDQLATAMTVKLIVGDEDVNDDYEIKSIRLMLDEGGYSNDIEVMSVATDLTDFEIRRASGVNTDIKVNHEKRLKKLEATNVGTITESNIYKTFERKLVKVDSVLVYSQGGDALSSYDLATYDLGIYDPQSPTAWTLVRSASTST